MKIRWKRVYFPFGEWQNEQSEEVVIVGGFRATFEGEPIIVVMSEAHSSGGHGEPPMTANVPRFYYETTLNPVPDLGDQFIDVNDGVVSEIKK